MAPIRKSILVVDDEPAILLFFRGLLGSDYDLEEASTAELALERLTARRFDLLLTDKNLPGMNGLALALAAHRLDPNLRTVVITGFASVASAQEAITLGVVDYLVKPFTDLTELRDRLARAFLVPIRGASPSPPHSPAVHVFEDDPVAAQRICDALGLLGLTAQIFTDRVRRSPEAPRAVVVSWDLGCAPGPQAVHLAGSLGVPFVVVAREVTFEAAIEALRGGAKACLPKMVGDIATLAAELKQALA